MSKFTPDIKADQRIASTLTKFASKCRKALFENNLVLNKPEFGIVSLATTYIIKEKPLQLQRFIKREI